MKLFLHLPFFISVIILSAFIITIFLVMLKLIRKRIPPELLKENHEVAGFIYNAVCIIYAVLIAFVVYTTWNNLKETNTIIEQEANNLLSLEYVAYAYPDSIRNEIETTIHDYVIKVTTEEWESMADGKRNLDAASLYGKLNKIFISVDVNRLQGNSVISESLKNLNELGEYRRLRLLNSRQNVPEIIWVVLITCSIVLIVFTFFFGTKNIRSQYFMTAILIFVSVLVLYLINVMDHPFIGLNRITTDAFEPILSFIRDTGK